jgi:hypothetical protein
MRISDETKKEIIKIGDLSSKDGVERTLEYIVKLLVDLYKKRRPRTEDLHILKEGEIKSTLENQGCLCLQAKQLTQKLYTKLHLAIYHYEF